MNIANEIYEGVGRYESLQPVRGYLGMSSIGEPCEKKSWLAWRQTSGILTDGRILLLFELGRKVEEVVCQALRKSGYKLLDAFPDPQHTFQDHGGFFSGHPDGFIESSDGDIDKAMVLEIKSANTNKFKEFEKHGVEKVYPAYYAQMNLYMHYSDYKKTLFVVMKKDDSSIYTEEVQYNSEVAQKLIAKASRIIQTHEDDKIRIPKRVSEQPNSEECKWCRYVVPCFAPQEAIQTVQSCRSCAYLKIDPDFKPECWHSSHKVPLKDISSACPQWSWVLRSPF